MSNAPVQDRPAGAGLRYLRRLGGWRLAAAVVIGQWLALGLAGLAAPLFGPMEPLRGRWMELLSPATDLVARLVSDWQRWDALWYQHIALAGYGPDDGTTAFYPLFPMLARLVSVPLGGDIVVAELIVSAAGYFVALALLWRLVRLEILRLPGRPDDAPGIRSRRAVIAPTLTVLAVALCPVGFAFLAPYTDSLFLAFTVAMFLALRTGHPWRAGLWALLASLARVQGVLLALPLGWELLRRSGLLGRLTARLAPRFRTEELPIARRSLVTLAAALLPVAGSAGFLVYQVVVLGASTTGLGAQARWGYALVPPWEAVAASLGYIGRFMGTPTGAVEALNLAALLGFAGLALVVLARLPFAYALYVLPWLAILASRQMTFSPLMSVARYTIVAFPCFVVVALTLEARPRLAALVLVVGGVLQLALFQYWVRWGFVA